MSYVYHEIQLSDFALDDCVWCGGCGVICEPKKLGVAVIVCTCVDRTKLLSISHVDTSSIVVRLMPKRKNYVSRTA